ncbi:MAG: serine/threonine protein kinase [Planctomycetes bacterium]|nr:serine/threonine protein kinase [Planctomycetota bacterium]
MRDDHGEAALERFLAGHADDAVALRRTLRELEHSGLLARGPGPAIERLGDFRIVRELGAGGMGVVFEAEQMGLGRRVALKVLRPELRFVEGGRERFRREVEAIARLEHPSIVPVLQSGEDDGVGWYAMPLIPGCGMDRAIKVLAARDEPPRRAVDLQSAIAGADAPPSDDSGTFAGSYWQACVRLVRMAALGLHHAHRRGIVHRDVKPSNVMLTPDGRALVLDFGLAHVLGDAELTRTGSALGSPAYMSPEQVRGEPTDERTDIYSLAATLHHLLTLAPPFPVHDAEVLRARILLGTPEPLRARALGVPVELAVVVRVAMDLDRDRRYADAKAFADDLAAVLELRPIRARSLPLHVLVVRWAGRHRAIASALGVTLGFAVALPLVSLSQQRAANARIRQEADRAERGFTAALHSIDDLLLAVGRDRLRNVPEAQLVGADLVREAVAAYERLAIERPDSSDVRVQLVRGLSALASFQLHLGRIDELDATVERMLEMLPGDTALDVGWRIERATAQWYQGLAEGARGRHEAAEATFRRALAELDDLPATTGREAAVIAIRRARIHGALAELLAPRGRVVEAGPHWVHAIELLRPIEGDESIRSDRDRVLATYLYDHALHAWFVGETQLVRDRLVEALRAIDTLPPAEVGWPTPRALRAMCLTLRGDVARKQGEATAAADDYRASIAAFETLVRDYPQLPDLRSRLGATRNNLGMLERDAKHLDVARALFRSAIEDQERSLAMQPGVADAERYLVSHHRWLCTVLVELGDFTALIDAARALGGVGSGPDNPRQAARHLLRCADASPSRAEALRQEALDLLLESERRGWGKADLDGALYEPLRARPEFQALVRRRAGG